MGFKCGLVGLPNVGKSTIFNALTAGSAAVAGYPFTTVEPNVGVAAIPDERLEFLVGIAKPEKAVRAALEVVDIAGLIKGASRGEGLGNQFLSNIRAVDAIFHVVRCFEDENIPHVNSALDPLDDISTIETELILSDLALIDKRLQRDGKAAMGGDKEAAVRARVAEKAVALLNQSRPLRAIAFDEAELAVLESFDVITQKPVLLVANVDEAELADPANPLVEKVRSAASAAGAGFVALSGKIEAEIAELPPEERREFLSALGLQTSGLERLAEAGYRLLHLISFFTVVGAEVRAWAIRAGTPARKAAGKIHTDMERGFIKAEVIAFDGLKSAGTLQAAREKGVVRMEGKEYVIQDGDVVTFRFNV